MPRPRPTSRFAVVDSPPDDRYVGRHAVRPCRRRAAATDHLLSLGHRDRPHIAGPSPSFAASERERGLATRARGRRGRARRASSGAIGPRHPVTRRPRRSPDDPAVTAVFGANDQMALGAIRALAEPAGACPGGVERRRVRRCADAADYRPPLTTVRQDFDALGELAVAAAHRRIGARRAALRDGADDARGAREHRAVALAPCAGHRGARRATHARADFRAACGHISTYLSPQFPATHEHAFN